MKKAVYLCLAAIFLFAFTACTIVSAPTPNAGTPTATQEATPTPNVTPTLDVTAAPTTVAPTFVPTEAPATTTAPTVAPPPTAAPTTEDNVRAAFTALMKSQGATDVRITQLVHSGDISAQYPDLAGKDVWEITYDVTPATDHFIAGNGEQQGNWMIGKFEYLWVTDNVKTIVEAGTGP